MLCGCCLIHRDLIKVKEISCVPQFGTTYAFCIMHRYYILYSVLCHPCICPLPPNSVCWAAPKFVWFLLLNRCNYRHNIDLLTVIGLED